MKFYVDDKGDSSVGIWPRTHTINFETFDREFDAPDFILDIKQALSELFDVSLKVVFTEDEWENDQRAEIEYEREMDSSDEEARRMLDLDFPIYETDGR